MNLFTLTWANLRFKPLAAVFNVLLLAFGIATILTISHLEKQMGESFKRDLNGIDLVVSGKGSPLQIILSSVFHLDIPTGNISVKDAEKLASNPLVRSAIPLALGDNYQGFRIVGTTPDYIEHYQGTLSLGVVFSKEMEVVLGADVAKAHQLKLGDTIIGSHGLTDSSDPHGDAPYIVTGILAPSGSVLDRLVLTPVSSVWHVHEEPDSHASHHHAHDHNHDEPEHADHEYTALLIKYASPMAAATLPRLVNTDSNMQAASPAFEMARLLKLLGTGSELLTAFGILLAGFAAFGFFVTLSNAIHDRLYDLALMRTLGASRARIFTMILLEALMLGLAGICLGLLLAKLFFAGAAIYVESTHHILLRHSEFGEIDLKITLSALVLSCTAGIIPAIRAYRLNLTEILKRS
jgi:putative ABC transport system permease protein